MGKRNEDYTAQNNLKLPISDQMRAPRSVNKRPSRPLAAHARKHRAWLQGLRRESVENAVSSLIDLLDAMDATTEDLEPDNEDCCAASDDDPSWRLSDTHPGDADDAEQSPSRQRDQDGFAESQEQWVGRRIDGQWQAVIIRRRITVNDGS